MQYSHNQKFPYMSVFEQILDLVQNLGQELEVLSILSSFQVFFSSYK
jgi:hypothetical protein